MMRPEYTYITGAHIRPSQGDAKTAVVLHTATGDKAILALADDDWIRLGEVIQRWWFPAAKANRADDGWYERVTKDGFR